MDKSVSEIHKILSTKGARKIMTEYDPLGCPSVITFTLAVNDMEIPYRLPANYRGVLKVLNSQKVPSKYKNEPHAKKVCWRIIKVWIESQLSIVECEQADMATIFLPYGKMSNGQTVAENLLGEKGKQFFLIE